MAILRSVKKIKNCTGDKILTFKENINKAAANRYKKFLIASGILNILLISYVILTTILCLT